MKQLSMIRYITSSQEAQHKQGSMKILILHYQETIYSFSWKYWLQRLNDVIASESLSLEVEESLHFLNRRFVRWAPGVKHFPPKKKQAMLQLLLCPSFSHDPCFTPQIPVKPNKLSDSKMLFSHVLCRMLCKCSLSPLNVNGFPETERLWGMVQHSWIKYFSYWWITLWWSLSWIDE